MATELRFDEVLRVLVRNEVEFIVVGGVAAILQGSPLTTEDVDVVYLSSEENNLRLAKEHADRPKDRYQLLFLRQLLAEIQRLEAE